MTDIIAALQEEIAAAQKERGKAYPMSRKSKLSYAEYVRLGGYIQGLNQALYLLTKEPVKELEY